MKLDAALTIMALMLAGSGALACSMALDARGGRLARLVAFGLAVVSLVGFGLVCHVLTKEVR
jgi:hypothetical protein